MTGINQNINSGSGQLTAHDSPRLESRKENSIGFLRLALAAMVIYTHAYLLGGFGTEPLWTWSGQSLILGTVGVQGFFVLSGMLVASSWVRQPSLFRFLWHRFLRLTPAFWACLIITAFVFTPLLWVTTPGQPSFFSLEPSALGYVWHNLNLLQKRGQLWIGPFPNNVPYGGEWNGSMWTIYYEAWCYLIIVALGLIGFLGRQRIIGLIILLGVLGLYSIWTALHPAWMPHIIVRIFDTPGKQLSMFFLAGAAWTLLPKASELTLRYRVLAAIPCVLLIASWRWQFHAWFAPWVMPIVVFWLASHLPFRNLERWARGDYSYGLYLYGFPLEQVLAHFRIYELGFGLYILASYAAAGLFAIASWHLIEKFALKWKNPTLS